MCGTSSSNCDHNKIGDIPTSILYIFKKWNIFIGFFLYFFLQKFVVGMDEFYKLYYDVWCRLYW